MSTTTENLIVVLITCGSNEEARRLSEGLIRGRMAACVNITGVDSVFHWKGTTENQSERLLIVKTVSTKFDEIEKFIKANHSYECPEIIAVKVGAFSDDYAAWVRSECGAKKNDQGENK